uniref:Uncharacterized protein n=1 Tax=Anguilla anguilla TaxID=7936 RepID=A0A0E9VIL5_ANGAN
MSSLYTTWFRLSL